MKQSIPKIEYNKETNSLQKHQPNDTNNKQKNNLFTHLNLNFKTESEFFKFTSATAYLRVILG